MRYLTRAFERFAIFILLLVAATVFWPPNAYFNGPATAPSNVVVNVYDTFAFFATAAFLAIGFLAHRRQLPGLLWCGWPILLMLGLAFLSATWADAPDTVLRRSAALTVYTMFGFYLALRLEMDEFVAMMVKLWAFAVIASLVMIVVAPRLAISGNVTYAYAWRGAFTDKNILGSACGLGVIFSVYALRHRYGPRWIAVITILGSLVLLKLSESKTPIVVMLAVAYAALIGTALRRRSGLGLVVGFAATLAALATVSFIGLDPVDALAALGRDPTLTNRVPIWHLAIGYIERHPWLGYGYEGFWRLDGVEANQIWATMHWRVPHAHNGWIEIGLSLGLVGIGVMAFIWLCAVYRAVRVITLPHARHAVFCLALMAGVLMENMTEYAFFRRGEILWLLFVIAFVYLGRELAASHARQRADAPALPLPRTALTAYATAQIKPPSPSFG